MRVQVTTIEDFCDELREEAKLGHVHRGIIRVRIDSTPEQDEAITFEIGIWATALIRTEDGDFVLEFGCVTGSDTPNNENGGTKVALLWRERIAQVCDEFELQLRHGKFEVF